MSASQSCPIVALIGRPNVGKSTFFNRVTKSRKALVDPTPGVTRDRQYERVSWDDATFLLVDTGGIDDTPEDLLVNHIREQAMAAVAEADIILFLMDARQGVTPADYEIVNLLRRIETKLFYVINKIDSPEQETEMLAQFYELGIDQLWPVSAEHAYGFQSLMGALAESVGKNSDAHEELADGTARVAFFGRPNVGKSSLINRILGKERMVVSDISGTTRDSVDTVLTHGKYSYVLIDTAGIRRKGKTKDKLEKFSILKSLGALERCDVAVVLLDAEEGITEQDSKVIGYALDHGRGLIILVNKWDLIKDDRKRQEHLFAEIGRQLPFVGFAPLLKVSAKTGYGVKRLFPTIGSVFRQYQASFTTSALNRLLADALEKHPPPMYKNKRLKFYYTSQIGRCPPRFVLITNSAKGVHFSYQRYLTNRYREGLGLDKIPLQLIFKEKKRNK